LQTVAQRDVALEPRLEISVLVGDVGPGRVRRFSDPNPATTSMIESSCAAGTRPVIRTLPSLLALDCSR
jgi:hypothetical protein